ncbi:hypothetical protein GJAV_G00068750 [Gymnothorax javanicus]|nr:hypothetical protein GJAV_G00068750 [Gymnothorax javanicus]
MMLININCIRSVTAARQRHDASGPRTAPVTMVIQRLAMDWKTVQDWSGLFPTVCWDRLQPSFWISSQLMLCWAFTAAVLSSCLFSKCFAGNFASNKCSVEFSYDISKYKGTSSIHAHA